MDAPSAVGRVLDIARVAGRILDVTGLLNGRISPKKRNGVQKSPENPRQHPIFARYRRRQPRQRPDLARKRARSPKQQALMVRQLYPVQLSPRAYAVISPRAAGAHTRGK